MKFQKAITFTALALCSPFLFSTPAAAKPISIEDIARHSAIDFFNGISMSPDGKHIAGLVAVEGEKWPVISIWKTDDLEAKPVWIPTKEMRYRGVRFLGNDRILFYADQPLTVRGKNDFTVKLFTATVDGRDIEEPMRQQGTLNDAVRAAESRGITINIFNENVDIDGFVLIEKQNVSNGAQEIFQLNTATGNIKKIASTGDDWAFLSSMVHPVTGELLGKFEIKNIGGDYFRKVYLRDSASSPWVEHPALGERIKDRRDIQIIGFDGGADKLVVLSNANTEYSKAYNYSIQAKSFDPNPIFENPNYDILNVAMGKNEGDEYYAPIGVTIGSGTPKTVFTSGYWTGVQKTLNAKFPDMNVVMSNRRTKLKKAVIEISNERTPPSYMLFDNGKITPLGNSRPWMNSADMGKSRWISYTARDGLKVPAILTLPPNYTRAQGKIPTIVHPHGGPWSRDRMGWDASMWTQFLTSRGIVVIQPQFRGSTGLGQTLWKAGDMEWGQKMSDDNDDAASFLVKQGIADPDKLAIFGYSYGGFAAIAASVRPNSPYQCAISGAGVSSLQRIKNEWGSNRLSQEFQEWTVDGMDPIKNVDKANIPIMLYHGDGDRQADTEHSRIFYKAMMAAGKDVEYIEIDTMWHQLPWYPEWHVESLTAIERFLGSDKCGLISSGVN